MICKKSKNLRKRIARVSWINIMKEVERRGVVKKVDPYLTSKTFSRCGFIVKDLKGQVFSCLNCGLVIDRQKNACVNIYLKMKGFSHSYKWWERFVRPLLSQELWVGLPGSRRRPMICSPMKGELRFMKSKGLVENSMYKFLPVLNTMIYQIRSHASVKTSKTSSSRLTNKPLRFL